MNLPIDNKHIIKLKDAFGYKGYPRDIRPECGKLCVFMTYMRNLNHVSRSSHSIKIVGTIYNTSENDGDAFTEDVISDGLHTDTSDWRAFNRAYGYIVATSNILLNVPDIVFGLPYIDDDGDVSLVKACEFLSAMETAIGEDAVNGMEDIRIPLEKRCIQSRELLGMYPDALFAAWLSSIDDVAVVRPASKQAKGVLDEYSYMFRRELTGNASCMIGSTDMHMGGYGK